jgi:hypothetical protein
MDLAGSCAGQHPAKGEARQNKRMDVCNPVSADGSFRLQLPDYIRGTLAIHLEMDPPGIRIGMDNGRCNSCAAAIEKKKKKGEVNTSHKTVYGSRILRVRRAFASASPMKSSFSKSHVSFRPKRMAISLM